MNPGDLLADRLRRLDTDTSSDNDDVPVRVPDDPGHPSSHSGAPTDRYGFRPPSGLSSPSAPPDRNSPLPDVNGLGWPGVFSLSIFLPFLAPLTSHHSLPHITSQIHPFSPQCVTRRDGRPPNQTRHRGAHRARVHW